MSSNARRQLISDLKNRLLKRKKTKEFYKNTQKMLSHSQCSWYCPRYRSSDCAKAWTDAARWWTAASALAAAVVAAVDDAATAAEAVPDDLSAAAGCVAAWLQSDDLARAAAVSKNSARRLLQSSENLTRRSEF